ncbi:hypothetical protein AURDEDRAFT_169230 [Auricularia subglabra TFB-10046 SS5]|nr:hypothetical protein AURDEDRAFT_169230 [Auricularia subglabra TFB-10046 SS5]
MLVNGGTYDSVYWDMQIQPDTYSFVRFAANKGYPTLSVTRLGGGGSSRPSDPLGVVQFPLEVAIQEKIMDLVHFGGIEAVGRPFEKVAFIGHSMGSILLNGLLAAAPDSLSAAVFTGYSHSPNNIDLKTIANMQPARGVDPSKFGALPAGYWTTATLASRRAAWYGPAGSFDPAVAAYDHATMDVVSEGQWDTWPRLLIAVPDFKGDVLTMNGQNDPVFCTAPDCANIAEEAQFYPNARSVESDYLRLYREKMFVPYTSNASRAYRRTGSQPTLPPQIFSSFDALCSIPGLTFVDKSTLLHSLLSELSSARVGIIRRPKGFGKTAFLSMFDAFFDPLSVHAYLPFASTGDVPSPVFRHRGQLLVFALDLAELKFEEDMSSDGLEDECDRFMDAAAQKFYARYKSLLRVQDAETSNPGFSPTFLHIIRWSKCQGWKLCFTIDNYTAPVLDGPTFKYKCSISEDIFRRLRNLVCSTFFLYGLVVGDDVAHATQWPGLPTIFSDLTDDPAFAQAIGFTVDDVVALGQALCVDLIGAFPSGTPTGRYAKRVYAAADIMALARSVTGAGSPDEPLPTKVRTFKHATRAKAASSPASKPASRRKPASVKEPRIPVLLIDPDDDVGPPDGFGDDGYEGDGDRSLPLPDLTDGSSGSSSSSSSDDASDGRSSAPSSGGGKDKFHLLPVADEPPSPLNGYDKQPWVSGDL